MNHLLAAVVAAAVAGDEVQRRLAGRHQRLVRRVQRLQLAPQAAAGQLVARVL